MRKLLRADFTRLKSSKTFWVSLLGMAAICALVVLDNYGMKQRLPDEIFNLEGIFFNYAPFLGFFCAMIVGTVVGADYNDGTIRNKLVAGCERRDIYFSHLVVCFAVSVALVAAFVVPGLAAGLPASDGFGISTGKVAEMISLSLLTAMAFASICASIALGIQNRTAAVIVSFVAMALLLAVSMLISGRLNQPEMTYDYVMFVDGQMQIPEMKPNPYYISGVTRTVYQWIHDILPSGQAIQIANGEPSEFMWRWPFTSALVILLSSGIGCAIFKRKDIK